MLRRKLTLLFVLSLLQVILIKIWVWGQVWGKTSKIKIIIKNKNSRKRDAYGSFLWLQKVDLNHRPSGYEFY